MRRASIGLCVATQIARCTVGKEVLPQFPGFASPEIAWAVTQGQLAWYRAMEEAGEMRPVRNREELDAHLAAWEVGGEAEPIGYVLSLEGADSLIDIDYLHRAHAYGLRALGPTHYGPGRYAAGTAAEGSFTPAGRALLKEMAALNIICDIPSPTRHRGALKPRRPLWASHSNCRALVPGQRQLATTVRAPIGRGAVIGAVCDAWRLSPGWERGVTAPREAGGSLQSVADHIDYICQMAGNADHAGIGSDLDGGFGTEQGPVDVDTIADLGRLSGILATRGYTSVDVEKIMGGNWIRFLRACW